MLKTIALIFALATLATGFKLITPARAMTHTDICVANRDQCLRGCDGMAQCSNTCEINYQGCLRAGE
ncbi:MAG: hypothetical protein ACYDEV_13745 [Acidiferrobacter sp.]